MEAIETIREKYQKIILESEHQLQKARKHIRQISVLRIALFIEIIASILVFRTDGPVYLFTLAGLPFVVFLWLIKRHNRWFYRKDFLKKKIEINEQELRALQYDFSDFDDGEEYLCPSHLYTFDLDVFGRHSLFQSVNRTSTPIGKRHLSDWFNAHSEEKQEIERRQEAVRELSADLEYRQLFRLFGLLNQATSDDLKAMQEWIAHPARYRKHVPLRILPTIAALLNLSCITGAVLGLIPASVAGLVFVSCVLLSFSFSKGITSMQTSYARKLQILSAYADQIFITEKKQMHSIRLQEIKKELDAPREAASQAVNQLSKWMNALDQRNNLLISTLLNGLLFWELRQVMKIEKWKEAHAAHLPQWLEAIGKMDAYCSLATFAYNHPDYIYPEVSSGPFHLQAEALGHPLMERGKCVRNGIDIEKRPSFVIITGANMAGKSTYLRTIGVNYLLACIGAPVWAKTMNIVPARLVTSLRTSDSLNDNESYFFAELKRLKLIIDKLKAGEELFIILDEILKGTNSMDKQKGSFALIKQLISLNANGIIATHDLLLSTLSESFPTEIQNFRFEADIRNDELTFSYQMREGVAQNMNACFLMKKMGIAVIDD